MKELTDAQSLRVETDMNCEITVTANHSLVEVLVKNLLENAMRYSQPSDTIGIKTAIRLITFSNPGQQAIERPDRLFERFYKQGNHNKSLGLGLAMVKKICEVNGWEIAYEYREGRHEFQVAFFTK